MLRYSRELFVQVARDTQHATVGSLIGGNHTTCRAIADHKVAQAFSRFVDDEPYRTGACLLPNALLHTDDAIRLWFAIAVHPEQLDGMLALILKDDRKGIAIGTRWGCRRFVGGIPG